MRPINDDSPVPSAEPVDERIKGLVGIEVEAIRLVYSVVSMVTANKLDFSLQPQVTSGRTGDRGELRVDFDTDGAREQAGDATYDSITTAKVHEQAVLRKVAGFEEIKYVRGPGGSPCTQPGHAVRLGAGAVQLYIEFSVVADNGGKTSAHIDRTISHCRTRCSWAHSTWNERKRQGKPCCLCRPRHRG